MADVDCDACHDPAKPLRETNFARRCETCHEKGYGEMLDLWKQEAAAGRAKAAAALEELRKAAGAGNGRRALVDRLDAALAAVDRAGPLHNPELADAVYARIVRMASEARQPSAGK
jgi:hypothetical protein